ncbi:hypothetical protein GP486_007975 [Trichoglossum hirsutum]|uniref:Transglycosylase SLT domain-containing protein n=1 Tax=Trichoglossum hirsutum TaxID=265104 RepID=A0A9P8L6K7_9PEZI|nr:hypothetical protein GP486_007975 [Trichoglossum hirsutum]
MPSLSFIASLFTFAALPGLSLSARLVRFSAQSTNPGLGVNPNAHGATASVTPNSGPNGAEDWLNSGLKGNGWSPPHLDWHSLVKIDIATFYSGAGANCRQYDWAFQASGKNNGIEPVFLAMIAMQESSCNKDAGGGTPGLMQVACGNYPDGQCTKDVAKNVEAGAVYLRKQLQASGYNAIKALASYNGWFTAAESNGMNGGRGLTESYPCSPEGHHNGDPQNLDYLHQTLNGWFLGLDPQGQDSWIGEYQCRGCQNGKLC